MRTKERSIILSADEVRGVLAGTLTELRRPVKFKGAIGETGPYIEPDADPESLRSTIHRIQVISTEHSCPFGKPGSRLWVRETWATTSGIDQASLQSPRYKAIPKHAAWAVKRRPYQADPSRSVWRSPVHMPRWASRITLEITSVRVEKHDVWEWVIGVKRVYL